MLETFCTDPLLGSCPFQAIPGISHKSPLHAYAVHAKIYQDIPRLSNFKSWADEEFGGVRAAFTVLDEDNSGDFNVREFIKMLRGHRKIQEIKAYLGKNRS